jgi:hypothetical protein
MKKIIAVLGLILLALSSVGRAQARTTAECSIDTDLPSIPSCALETRHGQVHVGATYLPLLLASAHGRLIAVRLPTGWAYVDRHGRVVVTDVAVMDNGANDFHHGLVRVTRNGKWGLADAQGRLVVPLRYDGMLDYRPGKGWSVCSGCRAASDGEHGWFEGGEWASLDRHGRMISRRRREP